MNTNKKPTKSSQQKNSRQDKNSSGTMKIFYVLMLVLMLSSGMIRIAGASRHNQTRATPTPQANPASSVAAAARVFTFHHEDSGSSTCTDLVIPSVGSAIYSNCNNGVEKQYDLSDTERSQLDRWIQRFQPVNFDHTDPSEVGAVTNQFYLNGQGSQQASNADIQAMIDFAETLVAKIASQP